MHRIVIAFAASSFLFAASAPAAQAAPVAAVAPMIAARDVVRVKSLYSVDETVKRLKADLATKGIILFAEIDQAQLGANANIMIRPSTLILFGNPSLGVQFLASNPFAGLDWPVRMLILEEADGSVTIAWTDFRSIAARFGITDRDAQFDKAAQVAASIASSATK